jgi:hypothetical protein
MQTFVKFRGHQPSVNGLLRNRGLIKDEDVKIDKPKEIPTANKKSKK